MRMFESGNDTARRGLVTHLAVAQKLVERGNEVLQPLGNHLRYDLAYYVPTSEGIGPFGRQEARLVRIQCKTARMSEDQSCLKFNTYNMPGGEQEKATEGKLSSLETIVLIRAKFILFL